MRPIEHALHIGGRSSSHTATVIARVQQPHELGPSPVSSTPSSSSSPLPTVRIQQATISTSQQFTIAPATTAIVDSTMPPTKSETAVSAREGDGLSAASIAGFAMLPVALLLVVVAIFTYFWLRKRRREGPEIRHLGLTPPPPPNVPGKDFRSPSSSFDSTASGGKVRSMTAMITPGTHNEWVVAPHSQTRPSNDSAVHHNPWHNQVPKISADITTASLRVPRGDTDEGNDSPIDRSSPFRLKRGDTTRRSSLDPDVMSAWPAPPQPAVVLQSSRARKTYMERRSISAEYFAQEKDTRNAQEAQGYWEDIRLELGPDPGPMLRSH